VSLDLEDFLAAATEASKRTRKILFALVVASVLLLAALLNSLQDDWTAQRLRAMNDAEAGYVTKIIGPSEDAGPAEHAERYRALYQATARAYVETAFLVRVPLFGFTFDVNDLGILGGLALVVLLTIFRFALTREVDNLRIAFAHARPHEQRTPFYHLLAMEQVLTAPQTARLHRGSLIRNAPRVISFFPLAVYLAVVGHDLTTIDIGEQINTMHTTILFGIELIALATITSLTIMVKRRLERIDATWDEEWTTMNPPPTMTTPPTDSDNNVSHNEATAKKREFIVEPPVQYGVTRAALGTPESSMILPERVGYVAEERPLTERRAVFVAHGMGSQIPFGTLDAVVTGLQRVEAGRKKTAIEQLDLPRMRPVRIGNERLSRVELTLDGKEVHLYEAYWAPLTEGRISLRDVMRFLLDGGVNGIRRGLGPFCRWMFGRMIKFDSEAKTVVDLFAALGVMLSLFFMNTVIVAIGAARLPLQESPKWLTDELFADITSTLNLCLVLALPLALLVLTAVRVRPVRRLLRPFLWFFFAGTVVVVILAGLALFMIVTMHFQAGVSARILPDCLPWIKTFDLGFAMTVISIGVILGLWELWRAATRLSWLKVGMTRLTAAIVFLGAVAWFCWCFRGHAASLESDWWQGISWPVFIIGSLFVRNFLVQYLGDVAVYVTPHTLDRFEKLRQEIRDCVFKKLHAVYAATNKPQHEGGYERIAVVAHSLGSVIVYDALNRMITEDLMVPSEKSLRTTKRTAGLVTFGSPLDKTAFLFGMQGTNDQPKTPCPPTQPPAPTQEACSLSPVREALAATVQPLIQDYKHRTFPWINIYSPDDIIGGSLEYYDDRKQTSHQARHIQNKPDPEANVLFVAHNQYWNNCLLWQELYNQITA